MNEKIRSFGGSRPPSNRTRASALLGRPVTNDELQEFGLARSALGRDPVSFDEIKTGVALKKTQNREQVIYAHNLNHPESPLLTTSTRAARKERLKEQQEHEDEELDRKMSLDMTDSAVNRLKAFESRDGVSAEVSGSNLSDSRYVELTVSDDSGDLSETLKIRISDHDLPPSYGQGGDIEIGNRTGGRGGRSDYALTEDGLAAAEIVVDHWIRNRRAEFKRAATTPTAQTSVAPKMTRIEDRGQRITIDAPRRRVSFGGRRGKL